MLSKNGFTAPSIVGEAVGEGEIGTAASFKMPPGHEAAIQDEREFKVVFGYVRASRDHQKLTLESQKSMIQRWWEYQRDTGKLGGADRLVIVEEPGVSASKIDFDKRPKGDYILRVSRPGDTIVVSNYDRMFRSLNDCVSTTDRLIAMGIDLVVMDANFDTSTPVGRAAFRMLAVFKAFECDERSRRIKEAKRAKWLLVKSGLPCPGGSGWVGWKKIGSGREAYMVPDARFREITQWLHTALSEKLAKGERVGSEGEVSLELGRIGRKHEDRRYREAYQKVARHCRNALSAYLCGWPAGSSTACKWSEVFRMKPPPAESLDLPVDE